MERAMNDLSGTTGLMRNFSQIADLMRNVMQATQNYNAKVMEFASVNSNATIAYLTRLATTKTPSEVVELTTRHVREQTEALTRQAKELTDMAQKLMPRVGQASS
jgi:hypothetical protein